MNPSRAKRKTGSTKVAKAVGAGCGIGAAEFARRRRALIRVLGKGAVAVVPAAPQARRVSDVEYPYRQNSDLAYLTGFCEPEACAVFVPGRDEGEYVLFCRPRDGQRETWDGPRAGCAGAVRDFGADQAFPFKDFNDVFPRLIGERARVYFPVDDAVGAEATYRRLLNVSGPDRRRAVFPLEDLTQELRLHKSRAELALMGRAAVISAAAHRRAMRACRPGAFEYQLAAEIEYEFQRAGAVAAYPSIVGGGANACVLHYTRNGDALKDGALVLIDAGAEYRLYASDVTRTFPVNGRFKPAQRELYEVVLEAQRAAVKKVRPGNTWNDVHGTAVRVLTKGLIEFGLLKGRATKLIKDGEYRRFYMHRTGHWLGMDVHDVGGCRNGRAWRRFEPGMALTVEPGLYLRGVEVPRRWRKLGVRIEDSVVVTAEGARVLSADVPKEPDEVEALVSAGA